MTQAADIKATQARVIAVTRTSAASMNVPQARVLVVANIPARAVRSSQVRALAEVIQMADVRVTQARVLAVASGRFERPRVRAWTFTLDGHDFYLLRLPDETLVFDLSTERWHVWGSGDDTLWRAVVGVTWQRSLAAAGVYGSNIIVADDTLGVMYFLNPEGQVDDNPDISRASVPVPFQRSVVGQISIRGRTSVPCWGVEVYGSLGEQLSDDYVSVSLLTSDDQGHTYDDQGSQDINVGDYTARLDWPSLGQMQAPGRLFKVVDYGAMVRIDGLETPDAEPK